MSGLSPLTNTSNIPNKVYFGLTSRRRHDRYCADFKPVGASAHASSPSPPTCICEAGLPHMSQFRDYLSSIFFVSGPLAFQTRADKVPQCLRAYLTTSSISIRMRVMHVRSHKLQEYNKPPESGMRHDFEISFSATPIVSKGRLCRPFQNFRFSAPSSTNVTVLHPKVRHFVDDIPAHQKLVVIEWDCDGAELSGWKEYNAACNEMGYADFSPQAVWALKTMEETAHCGGHVVLVVALGIAAEWVRQVLQPLADNLERAMPESHGLRAYEFGLRADVDQAAAIDRRRRWLASLADTDATAEEDSGAVADMHTSRCQTHASSELQAKKSDRHMPEPSPALLIDVGDDGKGSVSLPDGSTRSEFLCGSEWDLMGLKIDTSTIISSNEAPDQVGLLREEVRVNGVVDLENGGSSLLVDFEHDNSAALTDHHGNAMALSRDRESMIDKTAMDEWTPVTKNLLD